MATPATASIWGRVLTATACAPPLSQRPPLLAIGTPSELPGHNEVGDIDQFAARILVHGGELQRLAGQACVPFGFFQRPLPAARLIDQVGRPRYPLDVQVAVRKELLEGPSGWGPGGERCHHGQRLLALSVVAGS